MHGRSSGGSWLEEAAAQKACLEGRVTKWKVLEEGFVVARAVVWALP